MWWWGMMMMRKGGFSAVLFQQKKEFGIFEMRKRGEADVCQPKNHKPKQSTARGEEKIVSHKSPLPPPTPSSRAANTPPPPPPPATKLTSIAISASSLNPPVFGDTPALLITTFKYPNSLSTTSTAWVMALGTVTSRARADVVIFGEGPPRVAMADSAAERCRDERMMW